MSNRSNMTMAGIAELAGVSISTVSRALADNPAIALSTREHIKTLAKEYGFEPNPLARGLRRQRTDTVGVIVPLGHQRDQHLTDPFIMAMIGSLGDALSDHGLDMLLRRIIPEDDDWLDRLAGYGRVDGVIVIGQSDQHEQLNIVADKRASMVVWGAHLPDARYVTVGSDNYHGGELAARHLIAQGRRRLLFLGKSDAPEFALREQGFRAECARHPDVEADYLAINLVPELAHQQLMEQLVGRVWFDGIFAVSDVIGLAAVDVLERSGVAVPQDVSIVGYDNVTVAGLGSRPLTTIDQHLSDGARAMVDRLVDLMAGKPMQSLVLEPSLLVRATSIGSTDQ